MTSTLRLLKQRAPQNGFPFETPKRGALKKKTNPTNVKYFTSVTKAMNASRPFVTIAPVSGVLVGFFEAPPMAFRCFWLVSFANGMDSPFCFLYLGERQVNSCLA